MENVPASRNVPLKTNHRWDWIAHQLIPLPRKLFLWDVVHIAGRHSSVVVVILINLPATIEGTLMVEEWRRQEQE